MLPASHLTASLSQVSKHIYLMRDRSTYVCVCMCFEIDGVNHDIYFLYHYCDVTATTGHWSMGNQNALAPTRIQLKHSFAWSTVSTCSEWMESKHKKDVVLLNPGQNVSTRQNRHPWHWAAESWEHLKLHGKCTIIVVTTIVRFSTEEDSLVTCWSIICTKRSYSFQYPIWKERDRERETERET